MKVPSLLFPEIRINEQHNHVFMGEGYIWPHLTLHINYTTYDLRRCQDMMSIKHRPCNIMVHAGDEKSIPGFHLYWYARIIGIYDMDVSLLRDDGVLQQHSKMYFLWVRWFGKDSTYRAGPQA